MKEDNEIRFQVYLNYLKSLKYFLNDSCKNYELFGNKIVSARCFQRIQGNRNLNVNALERLLRNAWFTEIQLNLSKNNPELIKYSNHWAPVQLYYSCFLIVRSFLLVSGNLVEPTHRKTLSAIASILKERPDLFKEPISILCTGDPEKKTEDYINLLPNIQIDRISSLSSSENVSYRNSYCMFLRTTRKRQLKNRFNEWKKKNKKKKIFPKPRKGCVNNLHPTSIFDVLYRLRIRSNYADADMYLLNIDNQEDAVELFNCLNKLCWHIFFVLELLIAKHIGKERLGDIISSFLEVESLGISEDLLENRWEKINNLF